MEVSANLTTRAATTRTDAAHWATTPTVTRTIDADFASLIHLDGSNKAKSLYKDCSIEARTNATLIARCRSSQLQNWTCGLASLETAFAYLAGGNKDPCLSQSAILHHIEDSLPLQHGVGSDDMLQVISHLSSSMNLPIRTRHCWNKSRANFRSNFIRELRLSSEGPGTQIILCNYARRLDGKRGAHWSPLSCATRSGSHVHIAEVAAHRLPTHWVSTQHLMDLMCTRVRSTGLMRGYIVMHRVVPNVVPMHHWTAPLVTSSVTPSVTQSVTSSVTPSVTQSVTSSVITAVSPSVTSMVTMKLSPSITPSVTSLGPRSLFFRQATPHDALLLAHVQVPAWKAAYRGVIENEFLDHSPSLRVKRKVEKWRKILTSPPHSKRTLVLCSFPSKVLGYVTVSEVMPRDHRRFGEVLPEGVNICAEMCTLYLATYAPRRQGLGRELFTQACTFIRNHWLQAKAQSPIRTTPTIHPSTNIPPPTIHPSTNTLPRRREQRSAMVLWCLAGNRSALNFYRKMGCQVALEGRARFGAKKYPYLGLVYLL